MKTISHSSHGRTYYFTGANADLWQIATEHSAIFAERDFDTLAQAFGSSDDNERVDASKLLITKLWKAHPELGPYPFLDCLSKFEFNRQFHSNYRDHVCHQLKVYLLGLGILSCSHRLRGETGKLVGDHNLGLVWLVTAVFHDVGYVVESEHSQPDSRSWKLVREEYERAMRNPLTALLQEHDLSDATEQQIQKAYSIRTPTLDGMGDLEQDALFQAFKEEGVKANLGQFIAGDRTPVQKYFAYAQKTASKRPPFKDHGVASALLLTKTWRDFDEYLEQLVMPRSLSQSQQNAPKVAAALSRIRPSVENVLAKRRQLETHIMRAAGAMSLHNITPAQWNREDSSNQGLTFDIYRIRIGKDGSNTGNPLAFMLAFVDTLQDWDRPTFSETPNEGALHSHDISVSPDKAAGKVLVYVKKDAEEFSAPPKSKHARYSRVVRCLKEFLDEGDVDSLLAWTPDTAAIPKAAPSAPIVPPLDSRRDLDLGGGMKMPPKDPWHWVALLRSEASRHGDLMATLQRGKGDSRPRYIDSGFAYWGTAPTNRWWEACRSPYYLVMKKGIATFEDRWEELLDTFEESLPGIYVSYGVGTGEKDAVVLATLKAAGGQPFYVPIDMSLDMLVEGAKIASKGPSRTNRIIPVLMDFSAPLELETVKEIRRKSLGDGPILFSLLGNTLANFADDISLLKTLAEVMVKGDLMLLEVAATNRVDDTTAAMASAEYRSIHPFELFVSSALTLHANLPVGTIEYTGEVCGNGEVLQIDINSVSDSKRRGRFINDSVIQVEPNERIRLYRSRKYSLTAIRGLVQEAGLSEVTSNLQLNERSSPFGLYLGLYRK
ncbi:L-histidine N(alpha)-methyltransferase [Pendulispora rubella]|uniref:L-histidine N(Alpha)-methyltransferase n=1 Tax=Pendulispora rubella TaxID=2741070 RepID=A0ABZ2KNX5_9BACT